MQPTTCLLLSACAAVVMAACGGGDQRPADSASATTSAADRSPTATTAAPSAAAEAPTAATGIIPGSPAPITGAIIEVRMVGDARGYRFEPATISAKPGDGVKFVVISGGPHEVAFDLDSAPAESRQQLQFNLPNATDGRSPLLVGEQETWTVSLGGLAPGVYRFVSTPRLPQGMKGEVRIH